MTVDVDSGEDTPVFSAVVEALKCGLPDESPGFTNCIVQEEDILMLCSSCAEKLDDLLPEPANDQEDYPPIEQLRKLLSDESEY
jgi:hypothetical protein